MDGPLLKLGLTEEEQEALVREYSINPKHFEEIQILHQPSLFLLKEAGEVKLIKKYRILNAERVNKLEEILRVCNGKKVIPDFFPTRDGKLILQVKQSYFSMMQFLVTVPLDLPDQSPDLATVIANTHLLLAALAHDHLSAPLTLLPERLETLLAKNDFSDLLPYVDQAADIKNEVRIQLVHNDLHQDNFICSAPGDIFIIDFESFSANPLVGDIMFAAFRLSNGNKQQIDRFMAAYNQANPLTLAEKTFCYLFLLADFIRKLGFILDQKEKGNLFYMKDYRNYINFVEQARQLFIEHSATNT